MNLEEPITIRERAMRQLQHGRRLYHRFSFVWPNRLIASLEPIYSGHGVKVAVYDDHADASVFRNLGEDWPMASVRTEFFETRWVGFCFPGGKRSRLYVYTVGDDDLKTFEHMLDSWWNS